ncbi:hypothetical protein RB653_000199 [Dictyostelium firmibasis]|uniref:Uncharacterized protein n=1 Tax=Dictyostelium firmibasis TaxID=79012 RepID=A0AAN7YU59_9MYCE
MNSSIEVVPIDFISAPVRVIGDIPIAVGCNANVTVIVNNNLKLYESISLSDAIQSLATVGELLKVAHSASEGHIFGAPIFKIIIDHQSLVYETIITCFSFVNNCIGAIKNHEIALRIATRSPQKSMIYISKTAEKANKEMAENSQKLVDFIKKLVEKSTDFLVLATGGQKDTVASEEREDIKKKGELEAKLQSEISDLKEFAEKASKESTEERKIELVLKYFCAFTKPLTQDLQRKSNTDLAENVVQLKNLVVSGDYMTALIKCFEIIIKTMGKVRTIFENTRLFWALVKTQYDLLDDVINVTDLTGIASLNIKYQNDITNQIKSSGLIWLTLAQINFVDCEKITDVKKNFDEFMSNLPGRGEAEAMAKVCCDEILKNLGEENKKIDEVKNESDKIADELKEA